MTKSIRDKFEMDYDTQWTHEYLKPDQALYFKAKTPTYHIVKELENLLKKKGLNIDYSAPFINNNFSRLYRNCANSYKGWRVRYRKPNKPSEDFQPISEPINIYLNANTDHPKRSLKQALNQTMLWTHRLSPKVEQITINGAKSCDDIAKQLNPQFSEGSANTLLKHCLPSVENLLNNYIELVQKSNTDLSNLLKNTNDSWQSFSKNLKTINDCYKQLQTLKVKNYTMSSKNVYDVLMLRRKHAKGWRVQFLDEKASTKN